LGSRLATLPVPVTGVNEIPTVQVYTMAATNGVTFGGTSSSEVLEQILTQTSNAPVDIQKMSGVVTLRPKNSIVGAAESYREYQGNIAIDITKVLKAAARWHDSVKSNPPAFRLACIGRNVRYDILAGITVEVQYRLSTPKPDWT